LAIGEHARVDAVGDRGLDGRACGEDRSRIAARRVGLCGLGCDRRGLGRRGPDWLCRVGRGLGHRLGWGTSEEQDEGQPAHRPSVASSAHLSRAIQLVVFKSSSVELPPITIVSP